ncbi:MAG: Ig-like domain-containing protein [Eubacterium sp.]|nr:Ig-like domain-containing protein [Eubacterium sp.]
MAAPVVTSAVALLANAYPKDTAAQRKERLFSCVRKVNSLSSACVTGGILDLSKIKTAKVTTTSSGSSTTSTKKVSVKKVKLNKKKATLKYKKKLKLKASVTPKNATNKKVKWTVSNKKYATVTQKGVVKAKKKGIGHTVKVYATAKDGSKKKAYCKVKIKK